MKITIKDVFNLVEGLNEINEKELPVSLAFKLQRNSLKISEESKSAQDFENKIVSKYRSGTSEDGQIMIKNKDLESFNKEKEELMAQEVEVDLQQIAISDLDTSELTIKPRTLLLLDKIIKEDKEDGD